MLPSPDDAGVFFFDNSPQRSGHLRATIEDTQHEGERRRHLVSLCKTCWVGRLDALDMFVDLFDSVVSTLKSISGTDGNRDWSPSNQAAAGSLFVAITSFQFLLAVIVTQKGLACTRKNFCLELDGSTFRLKRITAIIISYRWRRASLDASALTLLCLR